MVEEKENKCVIIASNHGISVLIFVYYFIEVTLKIQNFWTGQSGQTVHFS